MNYLVKHAKRDLTLLFVAALTLYGCSGREAVTEQSFVGKWKHSKLETPIYLYANGEWEIKTEDGAILQYGIWQYKDKKITWLFKQSNSQILHDVTPVLSATSLQFQVQENDGSTTIYNRQ